MAKKQSARGAKNQTSRWARFSLFFFDRYRMTFVLWLALIILGIFSFTSWLKREGFPPIQFPLTVASGTYFVDNAELVDSEITQPLSQELLDLDDVSEVQTQAGDDFFSFIVFFEEGVDPDDGTAEVEATISGSGQLPAEANIEYTTIDPASFLNEFDLLLSVYSREEVDLNSLEAVAETVAERFAEDERIERAETQELFEIGVDPDSGETLTRQTSFNRIGVSDNGEFDFFQSVTIGVDRTEDIDIIQLSDAANEIIAELENEGLVDGDFVVIVGADFAESIETQISSLQENLLTGLIAVSVISLLLITWRASIVTALFMVTVMLATLFILLLIGYSLNTITLFSLVLALGLFVDDATIIVEAIDANNHGKKKRRREVVKTAISKVASASFAGTVTTVLVFLPLAFISGILGEFIRILPVTVIIALLTSLTLSLTVIPFLSRNILLNRPQRDISKSRNPIARGEAWLAGKLAALPLLLRSRRRVGMAVAALMFSISFAFIFASGYFASRLQFNIFPPTKDADQMLVQITYPPDTTIEQAEDVADEINTVIQDELEGNIVQAAYGGFEQANERSADVVIELVPFTDRDVKSPELVSNLQTALDDTIGDQAKVRVIQLDPGPPVEEFPFKVQVFNEDPELATALAAEITAFLNGQEVTRPNGTTAQIIDTNIDYVQSIVRIDGQRAVEAQAAFDADDTSALVSTAQDLVEAEFTQERLAELGYEDAVLEFDFGQESDNAESFASALVVIPIALLAMYLLLTVQFKSFLQPLLIFMAIPFSWFGVFAGLFATDNPLSFFVQVGFIGLIGIAVNNTILLTDYANQERRAGLGVFEAISQASKKRFRPLVATSLTTVVALLPLALTDPFWEPLAYTIIFGLLSSTFLVIIAFPYYYIGAETLRRFGSWLWRKTVRRGRAKTA